MCGIAGRILHRPGLVGRDLVELMQAQRHRGADSTGFALYGRPRERGYVLRLYVGERGGLDTALEGVVAALREQGSDFVSDPTWDDTGQSHVFVRVEIDEPKTAPAEWVDAVESVDGLEVVSAGRSLEVVKDVGDAAEVGEKHRLGDFVGTHGLGHARLATESDVNPLASHPFWARPFPDVSIVHNGQLTNHHLWRRRLESAGYRFDTDNDSEVIAVWISDRMASGSSLEEALRCSISELDGVFTYLVSTGEAIGMAKDRLAIKPIVALEHGDEACMATEEQALRKLYREEGEVINYDGPALVRVWPAPAFVEVP